MKFLIDMNLSPQWVPFLEVVGHEAEHWRSVGRPDAADRELLAHAAKQGQVLATQDLDFGMLLALGGVTTPSVIQFRAQDVLPADVGAAFLSAVDTAHARWTISLTE